MAKLKECGKPTKDADNLERIADAVEKLAGEVGILREIVDRLQDDLVWAPNNDAFRRESSRREVGPPLHLKLDPLAPDWHERVNRFRPEDIAEEGPESDEAAMLF